MENYLQKLNPTLREYFSILSEGFPEFLLEYINTPAMQKQDKISISCGTYYSEMFDIEFWYSSLEHSIAVALIIWYLQKTKNKHCQAYFTTFQHLFLNIV